MAVGRGSGVIWKGESLIDGVPETLDRLRAAVGLLYNFILPCSESDAQLS
jgi:hypothetical protein